MNPKSEVNLEPCDHVLWLGQLVNLTTSGTYFIGFKNMNNNLGYCNLGIGIDDIIKLLLDLRVKQSRQILVVFWLIYQKRIYVELCWLILPQHF